MHVGVVQGLLRRCLRGIRGYEGACRLYFVSETAQVELRSGPVEAPECRYLFALCCYDLKKLPEAGAYTRPLFNST